MLFASNVLSRPEGPKIEAEGRERGIEFVVREHQAPPHQLGGLGSTVSSPAGFGAELRPPEGFTTIFSTPETIILLIVDHKKMRKFLSH